MILVHPSAHSVSVVEHGWQETSALKLLDLFVVVVSNMGRMCASIFRGSMNIIEYIRDYTGSL